MAAVTHVASIWTTTAGNKTLVSAFTPALGDLIVVVAASTGVATTIVSDTNADGLGTYSQVTATTTGFSTSGNLNIWIRDALIGSATSMNITATQSSSTGGGFDVFRVAGMTKASTFACLQSAGNSSGTSGTTPTPVFTNTPKSANPIIAGICNGTSPATMTQRAGYTEASDVGYSTPTTGLETMFINSGETSASIAWGGTSGSAYATSVVELDTSGPATIPNVTMAPSRG